MAVSEEEAYGAIAERYRLPTKTFLGGLKEAGNSYASLERRCNLKAGTLSDIMKGHREPSWRVVAALANGLDLELGQVIGESKEEERTLSMVKGYRQAEKAARQMLPEPPADFWLDLRDSVFRPVPDEISAVFLYEIADAAWKAFGKCQHQK